MEVRKAYFFSAGRWPAGKTYEDAVRAAVEEFTNCSCSCPLHGNFLQFSGRTRQGIVETADGGYVQAKLASRRQ